MKKILNNLSEEELRTLQDLIFEKLKLYHRARSISAMAQFNISDRVYFDHQSRRIVGTVTRLNQKTVSVSTDEGGHWTVAPSFLKKFHEADVETF